jgi:3-oxoacyl-[acyl-carrier protein] reductase
MVTPVYLVTGGSRGLGAGVAERLERDGATVLRVARTPLARAGGHGGLTADLATAAGRAAVVAACREHTPLAGAVLAAGSARRVQLKDEADEAALRSLVELNLVAPLDLVRRLLREDLLAPTSALVLLSSNLASRGLEANVMYAATKSGLEGAARSLARELGPRGIRVNVVAPGLVATDMTTHMSSEAWAAHWAQTPLRRATTAADIAGAVAFLLHEDSRAITGQVLTVDGGWSC